MVTSNDIMLLFKSYTAKCVKHHWNRLQITVFANHTIFLGRKLKWYYLIFLSRKLKWYYLYSIQPNYMKNIRQRSIRNWCLEVWLKITLKKQLFRVEKSSNLCCCYISAFMLLLYFGKISIHRAAMCSALLWTFSCLCYEFRHNLCSLYAVPLLSLAGKQMQLQILQNALKIGRSIFIFAKFIPKLRLFASKWAHWLWLIQHRDNDNATWSFFEHQTNSLYTGVYKRIRKHYGLGTEFLISTYKCFRLHYYNEMDINFWNS